MNCFFRGGPSSLRARERFARGRLKLQLPVHAVQLDEDTHLRAEHLGNDRRRYVIDGAEGITALGLHVVHVRCDENDRRLR